MPREEELDAEQAVTAPHAPLRDGRRMCEHLLAPSESVASSRRVRLDRAPRDLAIGRWRHLQRLPPGLLATLAIPDESSRAEYKPHEKDPSRIGDVLEYELREDRADRKRSDD